MEIVIGKELVEIWAFGWIDSLNGNDACIPVQSVIIIELGELYLILNCPREGGFMEIEEARIGEVDIDKLIWARYEEKLIWIPLSDFLIPTPQKRHVLDEIVLYNEDMDDCKEKFKASAMELIFEDGLKLFLDPRTFTDGIHIGGQAQKEYWIQNLPEGKIRNPPVIVKRD